MSDATLDNILQQIDQLSEDDRLRLQERLADLAESQWQREAEAARRVARDKGIDEAAIDQAVEDVRYGQ